MSERQCVVQGCTNFVHPSNQTQVCKWCRKKERGGLMHNIRRSDPPKPTYKCDCPACAETRKFIGFIGLEQRGWIDAAPDHDANTMLRILEEGAHDGRHDPVILFALIWLIRRIDELGAAGVDDEYEWAVGSNGS